jgi:hypothetical protein
MINVLIFPSGSLVAKEIFDSLKYEKNIKIFGTDYDENNISSFYFRNYISGCPFIKDKNETILFLKDIIINNNIDYIYPAFDSVLNFLKNNEKEIGAKILAPNIDTINICNSKLLTYNKLNSIIPTPIIYNNDIDNIVSYPLYCKPICGYGSRDHKIIYNINEAKNIDITKYLICEYLTGDEYTVDCFTDYSGKLLYAYSRQRCKTLNGISVNTKTIYNKDIFEYANKINNNISMRGAWFFQVKYDNNNILKLLEIACRISGAMCTNRVKGINFPLLTIMDFENNKLSPLLYNNYNVECYKIYKNHYKVNIDFKYIYCDLDDTLIIHDKVNIDLLRFLYDCINNNKQIILITRNNSPLDVLKKYKISTDIFNNIITINKLRDNVNNYIDKKSNYILYSNSIFIDDSFIERCDVKENCKILVFSPSDIEIFN